MSVGRSLDSVDRSRLHVCSVDQSHPDSRLMSVGRSLGSVDRSRLDGCSVDQRRPVSRLMSVGRSLGSVDRSRLDGCPGRPRLPPHPPPPPGRPAPIERRDTAPIRTDILARQSTGNFKSLSPRRHSVGCRVSSPNPLSATKVILNLFY